MRTMPLLIPAAVVLGAGGRIADVDPEALHRLPEADLQRRLTADVRNQADTAVARRAGVRRLEGWTGR